MKISVKVPATSANIGPGFDCLGIALPIYNTITIEETVLPGTGIEINVIYDKDLEHDIMLESVPLDENSIIYKAIELLYSYIGQTPNELKITIHTQIPITRGLGSSSSVIVGGLLAANELLGRPADEAALLSIACELEGHPDNIVPAIVGGLTLAHIQDDGGVIYRKFEWPGEWQITACIPDFELSTDIARSALPAEVPMKDAIFNNSHLAMLVTAVLTKDEELMKEALHDKLHQPYRMKLVPGLEDITAALAHEEGVLGCVLSGAGPSILVISQKNALDRIRTIVKDVWAQINVKAEIMHLAVEKHGAYIIKHED